MAKKFFFKKSGKITFPFFKTVVPLLYHILYNFIFICNISQKYQKGGKEIFKKKERENYFFLFQGRSAFLCTSYYTIYCRTSFLFVIPVKKCQKVGKRIFLKKSGKIIFLLFKAVVPFYVSPTLPHVV